MKPSKSTIILRAGFLVVFILLLFSAWEFVQMQTQGARVQLSAYHLYVETDRAIVALRRTVWLGGNRVRNFFLNQAPNRQERFAADIAETQRMMEAPLRSLQAWNAEAVNAVGLVARLREYQQEMRQLGQLPANAQAGKLVEQRWSPKRIAAHDALEELTKLAQEELRQAEVVLQEEANRTQFKLRLLLLLAVGIGSLVAITSIRLTAKWETERQKHLAELSSANSLLEQLSARLLEIQEEERRNLSQELHDEVGQTLTALRMELSQALQMDPNGQTRQRLERAKGLSEKTVQIVRDISLMLRPALLDDLGLGPALQWQVEEFSRRSGVKTVFKGVEVGENLPDGLKTCIFRVAQEALNNVEKYSRAKNVAVTLDEASTFLRLEISDDGVGIGQDRQGPVWLTGGEFGNPPAGHIGTGHIGTGLIGMRQRLQKWKGQLEVANNVKGGARVVATVPFEHAVHQEESEEARQS